MSLNLKLFPQHTGVWEGTYRRISADGKILYEHASRLTLYLNGNEWRQKNEYSFKDGRVEIHDFGTSYFDEQGVLHFDNPRLIGRSWEAKDVVFLWWTYRNTPGSNLYEIITLLSEGHRIRTWQHTRYGVNEGVTMIEERRVKTQDEIVF